MAEREQHSPTNLMCDRLTDCEDSVLLCRTTELSRCGSDTLKNYPVFESVFESLEHISNDDKMVWNESMLEIVITF